MYNKSKAANALEKQKDFSIQASLQVENRYYETISNIVSKMFNELLGASGLKDVFIEEINKLKEPQIIEENKKNFFG